MRLSRNTLIAALGAAIFATVISPALGGPSLNRLIKREVTKQLAGKQGPPGQQGIPGVPGATGTPGGVLPSGATLTGVWAPVETTGGNLASAGDGVSFEGYTLASRPTPHVVPVGGPATTECPGSAVAPSAISGHLCVYVAANSGADTTGDKLILTDPTTAAINGLEYNLQTSTIVNSPGDGKVSVRGFKLLHIEGNSNASQARGSWAVTG